MKSTAWVAIAASVALSCSSGPSSQPQPQPQLQGRTYAPPSSASAQHASFASLDSKPILRAALQYPDPVVAKSEAPLSLTASDGSGLALISLNARAVVDGPLAFTELHLSFRNPRDREIEGRFRITLPPRATIGRLAMKIDSGWQEAEMVERQRARRAYEDFLHRKQDPALLEKAAGNEFRARIFPIPAKGVKQIIISYSQELVGSDDVYRLPLKGLPTIDQLSVTAYRAGPAMIYAPTTLIQKAWQPDRDFVVSQRRQLGALRAGDTLVARVTPELDAKVQRLGGVAILFDTSASRAPGFVTEVGRLGKLIGELRKLHGNDMKLVVATFDQQITPIFNGAIGSFGERQLQAVLTRRPLGASDLGLALTWLGRTRGFDRAIVISDGVPTMGKTRAAELRPLARALKGKLERIDAIAVGGIRDESLLAQLVRDTVEHDGVVLDGAKLAPRKLAKRVSQRTLSGITVSVPGATWVWPERLDGVQPGTDYLVYAKLPGSVTRARVELGGKLSQRVDLSPAVVTKPLLTRSAARAYIERLQYQRSHLAPDATTQRKALEKRIVELSLRHRVLSELTALLVLETDADYKRFKIDRNALADILRVGKRGVERFSRTKPVVLHIAKPKPSTGDRFRDTRNKGKKAGVKENTKQPASTDDEPRYKATAKSQPKTVVVTADKIELRPKPREQPTRGPVVNRPPPPPARVRAPRPDPSSNSNGESAREDSDGDDGLDGKIKQSPPPLTGKLAQVMKLIGAGEHQRAVVMALAWRTAKPGDVLALVALGEALEARGNRALAARVYGSIIDLFGSRADMRRFAGQRLERLGKHGQSLATDSYRKAVAQRPDHLTGHRLLAYALVREGKPAAGFEAAAAGLARNYPSGRFAGGKRALREDLGIIGAAWIKQRPADAGTVRARLTKLGVKLATEPSTRFIMTWETDANDVDFHIRDARGGHAWYSHKKLRSGGELFADVTNGYGPEVFVINGKATAAPYKILINYYSRGPMGYGMGRLEILHHDGNGGLRWHMRPYVVMNDSAWVNLGEVR